MFKCLAIYKTVTKHSIHDTRDKCQGLQLQLSTLDLVLTQFVKLEHITFSIAKNLMNTTFVHIKMTKKFAKKLFSLLKKLIHIFNIQYKHK